MDEPVEVLVTVVLAAEDADAARSACEELLWLVDGRIVESADCSAEEPDCWSVTLRVPSEERATHNVSAPLARAVRQFVRGLGPDFDTPRVACEPPTAWTVLDDPDAVDALVPGAERLLVEAWCGGDPYPLTDTDPDTSATSPAAHRAARPADVVEMVEAEEARDDPDEPSAPEPEVAAHPTPTHGPIRRQPLGGTAPADGDCRLTLRVDVATTRASGAEWQARALASRISRTVDLTGVTEHDGVCRVLIDLGTTPTSVAETVLTAVAALDRPGWSAIRWQGDTASTSWTARPRPVSGITELELSSSPAARRRRG